MAKTDTVKVDEVNPAEMTEPAPADVVVAEVVTWPKWGPAVPGPDEEISFHQLELAQFHGADPEPLSQSHLERFEDWCRSHNIGGTNRQSEGYWGEKTVGLIQAVNLKFLGVESADLTPQLWELLKAAGAPVVG